MLCLDILYIIRADVGLSRISYPLWLAGVIARILLVPAVLKVENFGRNARMWADAGATIVGGCCRTTPEHIRSVANHLAV